MSHEQQQCPEELAERMRRFMETRAWTKQQALEFLVGAGIATADGELAEPYRKAVAEHRRESSPITLQEARQRVSQGMDRGMQCPCCDQYIKRYRRKLNSGLAALLVRVYHEVSVREPAGGWLHVRDAVKDMIGTDYAILKHWRLIEPYRENQRRGRAGLWRLTEKGRQFVEGKTTVPEAVYLLNNEVHGFSEETMGIQQALGSNFDWEELMSGAAIKKVS